MILVRNIRLPLSAAEPQAFEKALHAACSPAAERCSTLGVAKLSVDARHGQPKLVYTVAVTLKQPAEEAAFAAPRLPDDALQQKVQSSLHEGYPATCTSPCGVRTGPGGLFQRCCWPGRAITPLCWSAALRWMSV